MKYIRITTVVWMMMMLLLLAGCATGSDLLAPETESATGTDLLAPGPGSAMGTDLLAPETEEQVTTEPSITVEEEPEPVSGEDLSIDEIKWLQESLKIVGFYAALDGDFGPATENQLLAFQESNDIEASGMLDSKTKALLEKIRKERLAPGLGTTKVMINKDYYLPSDYVPKGLRIVEAPTTKEIQLVEEAASKAEEMLIAAEKDGIQIFIVSGYRSYDYQENLFRNRVASYGFEEAEKVVAVPGESEHQTGLAMDISTEAMGYGLSQTFEADPAFAWMQENCADYGFILRYRKGKEDITGYIYEPWHYRYIGDVEMARTIMEEGIVFEEY